MSIWAIARITILRLGEPHGPILARVLLINTSNYKTGVGSFVPLPSLSVSPALDGNSIIYGRQSTFPLCNRINATVYRDIFYFSFPPPLFSHDDKVDVETRSARNGGGWRMEEGRRYQAAARRRFAPGFRKFNSVAEKAAGCLQFSRNCRLTNILERKLRKLVRRTPSNVVIASIFTRGQGEKETSGRR